MDIPVIARTKIQAEVLVPLVRALQAELGEERANAIVRKALATHYRKAGEQWWKAQAPGSLGDKMADTFERLFAREGALDYQVIQQTADAFDANVTGCRYAEFFKALGAPELGFLLVCTSDAPLAEGFGAEVQFTRTQTIMQGATHCDFRYRLAKKP